MSDGFFAGRFATMRAGIDFTRGAGLEIGPLDSPIARKSEGQVTYIDVVDAAALRQQYASQVDASRIVDIDALWGERTLAECVDAARFDYVMASHVAEHVPDLVTWLGEVESVLKPDGELRLAMPDCRFSFDVLRRETRLEDLLTNYLLRARRPTVSNVLDFRLHYAPDMDGMGRFAGTFSPEQVRPRHDFQLALDSAGWARDLPEKYFDVHCWVFQPRSFAAVMARLTAEGLVRFACARLIDPAPPLLEFYAFLRPCGDREQAAASWAEAGARAAAALPGSAEARAAEAAPVPERLARELAEARAALDVLRGSTSWRVTAPLRALARLLVRR